MTDRLKVETSWPRIEVLRERLQTIINERQHRALLAPQGQQLNILTSAHPGAHLRGTF